MYNGKHNINIAYTLKLSHYNTVGDKDNDMQATSIIHNVHIAGAFNDYY